MTAKITPGRRYLMAVPKTLRLRTITGHTIEITPDDIVQNVYLLLIIQANKEHGKMYEVIARIDDQEWLLLLNEGQVEFQPQAEQVIGTPYLLKHMFQPLKVVS